MERPSGVRVRGFGGTGEKVARTKVKLWPRPNNPRFEDTFLARVDENMSLHSGK